MTQSKDKYPENVVNPNFQKLLDRFHLIIKDAPKPDKISPQLNALKGDALVTIITGHQKDAIYARCNNYMNETYASTSKEYKVHTHTK